MKSYKIIIAVVVLLVIVNCVLLGLIWFGRGSVHNEGPPQRANEFLSKELKLNPEQQKAYDGMREEHFKHSRQLNDANRDLRDALFENIKTPKLDTATVVKLETQIADNQAMLEKITLEHFRQLRGILDKEQQKKFDEIIKTALHMMGGPPRGGKGPGDMPPPPDGQGPPPGEGPPPSGAMQKQHPAASVPGTTQQVPPPEHLQGRMPGPPPPGDVFPPPPHDGQGPPPGGGPSPDGGFPPPPPPGN